MLMKRALDLWNTAVSYFTSGSETAIAALSPTFTRNPGVRRQDAFALLAGQSSDLKESVFFRAHPDDYDALDELMEEFLQAGQTGEQLRADIARAIDGMEAVATHVQQRVLVAPLNLVERARRGADSALAPLVLRGQLEQGGDGGGGVDVLHRLIDAHDAVVMKMYDINFTVAGGPAYGQEATNSAEVVRSELGVDILVAAAFLNQLRERPSGTPITPHFAYLVDWFYGPRFIMNRPLVRFDSGRVAQYYLAEAADETLTELIAQPVLTGGEAFGLEHFVGTLFQILFSLEAAWDVGGFLHYDMHSSNLMVRRVVDATVRDADWVYERAPSRHGGGGRALRYQIPASVHGEWCATIIDFGSARAWCYTKQPRTPDDLRTIRRVLVTDASNRDIGRITGVNDADADRSVDVRTLCTDLLFRPSSIIDAGIAAAATPGQRAIVRQLQQLVVRGSDVTGNMARKLPVLLDVLQQYHRDHAPSGRNKRATAWLKQQLGSWAVSTWDDNALSVEWSLVERFFRELIEATRAQAPEADAADSERVYGAIRRAVARLVNAGREWVARGCGHFLRGVFIAADPELYWNEPPDHGALTPSTLLDLPLFARFAVPRDSGGANSNTVTMGVVNDTDLWEQPLGTRWPIETIPYPSHVIPREPRPVRAAAAAAAVNKGREHRAYAEARTLALRAHLDGNVHGAHVV